VPGRVPHALAKQRGILLEFDEGAAGRQLDATGTQRDIVSAQQFLTQEVARTPESVLPRTGLQVLVDQVFVPLLLAAA